MELRMRVERMATAAAAHASATTPAPAARVMQLVRCEQRYATLRWLRALLACYAVGAVVLASLHVDAVAHVGLDLAQHLVLLAASALGIATVYGIYHAKAHLAGLRSCAATHGSNGSSNSNAQQQQASPHDSNGTRPAASASVLHSPHVGAMVLEMAVWLLQAPPGLSRARDAAPLARALDNLVWLRLYAVALALGELARGGVFARAVAATTCTAHARDARSLRRRCADYAHDHLAASLAGVVAALLVLALFYSQAEGGAASYGDALYFCLATASFVGYGDYEPTTTTGRLCAALSWALGGLVLAGGVGLLRRALALTDAERNLHTLFRVNKLCARVPGEAARTVQRAWRLHDARRRGRHAVVVHCNALLLTQQAATFRALRRHFGDAERDFLRSLHAFDDDVVAGGDGGDFGGSGGGVTGWSPANSRPSTPRSLAASTASLSPRRRPFSLFHETRVKATSSSGGTTPRAARTPVTSPRLPPTIVVANSSGGSDGGAAAAATRATEEQLARLERSVDALAEKAAHLARALRVSLTQLDS